MQATVFAPVLATVLMSQVTVISGVERRRIWTTEQKLAVIAAASAPGSSVAEVARQADLRSSQIYRWKRELCGSDNGSGFSPVVIQPDRERASACSSALVIEVGGAVVRIAADASPALIAATVRALRR